MVKHWMRTAQARFIDAIHDHIAKLIDSIPSHECSNYMLNAGYVSNLSLKDFNGARLPSWA